METVVKRIPVISLWGPWAQWVALTWKPIETRTHQRFASLVGKRIGIHVAVKWDDSALKLAEPYLSNFQISHTMEFLRLGGAIICTAFVSEHRELTNADSKNALIHCTNEPKRYGLFLEDVWEVEAIPCRGKQGIWYYDFPLVEASAARGLGTHRI
jgi:hypothetical protein